MVVVGGALAGGATALALLKQQPDLRVLVVEREETFGRRVGESTVELSTYFLSRTLGLTRHLVERHIVKQGFRYWFANDRAADMGRSTEMGGRYLTRVASYQVDRPVLDEEVLARVRERGGAVWRPATVREIRLREGGVQELTVRDAAGRDREVRGRWVVDASGRKAMIARQRGEVRPIEGHPTAAVWARWRGTLDFDGDAVTARYPQLGERFYGTRHTATNHIMGDGWWAWVIPLKNGDTSIGVTWDQRLFRWPRTAGTSLGQQLREVLESHPVGRELLRDAELIEGDEHIRRNLPYVCQTPAADGFVLVGDAAGFIDPFYSMGLDNLTITATSGVDLILAERRGPMGGESAEAHRAGLMKMLDRHNAMVRTSLPRWFDGVFRDKYVYMGDFELMRIAFLVEISLYYMGLIAPPYQRGRSTIKDGMFYSPVSLPFFWFMRWVNRRLTAMALVRRRRGTFGRHNADRRMLVPGFAFDLSIPKANAKALWALLKLEVREGWRCWRPATGVDGSVKIDLPPKGVGGVVAGEGAQEGGGSAEVGVERVARSGRVSSSAVGEAVASAV